MSAKTHYFDQAAADPSDITLKLAITQGFVPETCLLAGRLVMMLVQSGSDPCVGCAGPREKCKGRSKASPRGRS